MDKEIKEQLKAKKASLKRHKKHIRNIIKHAHPCNFFGVFMFVEPCPKDLKRMKHHKYMINKITREINNMKKYFKNK